MARETRQMQIWSDEFGRQYTDRNALDVDASDALFQERFGLSRTEMNDRFLAHVDRAARVLEVGCNVGTQLVRLQRMGFHDLYGIDVQAYAVQVARQQTKGINIITGSAFDIPFKDRFFDLVFTSGVLIHIAPDDLPDALREIHRCTRASIWGMEYYATEPTSVTYRGHDNLAWKQDFVQRYLDEFADLLLVRQEFFKYRDSDNVDTMFLLQKR